MPTNQNVSAPAAHQGSVVMEFESAQAAMLKSETKTQRVERLHQEPGGAFMGWLVDEARSRKMSLQEMAAELKVTYGYINQMRNGIRKTEDISHDFCVASATFLGVPTIAIKIVAGVIRMSDFLHPEESEEDAVERAIRYIQNDPVVRQAVPMDLGALSFEAKRAVALMYVQSSSHDVFGLKELPAIVHWCQKAAFMPDDKMFETMPGCPDNDTR